MKQSTILMLDKDYTEFPVLYAGPAPISEITKIEEYANFKLPAEYISFLEKYGGALVGPYPIYGSGAAEAMGAKETSVIEVTERFRQQKWPQSESALVISVDHGGNAILLTPDHKIIRFDHDFGTWEELGDNFEDFLVNWCKK